MKKTVFTLVIFLYFFNRGESQTDTLYYNQAYYLDSMKYYDEAIDYYSRAIALNPHYSKAYAYRGLCYLGRGKKKPAHKDVVYAISLDTTDANLYNSLGTYYQKTGKSDSALYCYNKAILIDSLDAAFTDRGILYSYRKDYLRAESDFLSALKHSDKRNLGIKYYNLGVLYYETKRYSLSVDVLSKSIEHNPKNWLAFKTRADSYLMLSEFEKYEEDRIIAKSLKKAK